MAFYSAKNAKVRIGAGATVLTAKSWTVTSEADELDVTNFEGGGYTEVIGGIKKITVQIELDLDGAANPFDSPRSITPGSTIVTVKLYLNDTTGPYWSIPTLYIRSCSNPMEVRQSARLSISGTGTGSFVHPTG